MTSFRFINFTRSKSNFNAIYPQNDEKQIRKTELTKNTQNLEAIRKIHQIHKPAGVALPSYVNKTLPGEIANVKISALYTTLIYDFLSRVNTVVEHDLSKIVQKYTIPLPPSQIR